MEEENAAPVEVWGELVYRSKLEAAILASWHARAAS